MRRMTAPPALEVEATQVGWYLDTWAGDTGDDSDCSMTEAVSRVSIRARELLMDSADHLDDFSNVDPSLTLSPQEALFSILQSAPPGMQTFSLRSASLCAGNGSQTWCLALQCGIEHPKNVISVYHSAAQLAEGLQPHAVAARIGLKLDLQNQEVHLIGM